jgi:hypothetical protein
MERSGLFGFPIIKGQAKLQQAERIAAEFAAHPPAPAPPPPPKRAPGRPKRERTVDEALTAAAAAADPVRKRARHYHNWLLSPYINDILAAYARTNGSAKRAIALLRREAPDDRYAQLSHSTINSWHGPDKQLLSRIRLQLDAEDERCRRGPQRAFAGATLVEAEIKKWLLQMRTAGTPVNSRIIRWVMHAVITDMHPALLSQLKLSQSFISRWARDELQWRWRARTTTASKLPLDWEDQGVTMAMRVAAAMEMYQVSTSRGAQCH